MKNQPIGIFDSGIGGLTVAKHIHAVLPHEDIVYVADQAHVPYGEKTQQEIFTLTQAIIPTLIEQKAKLVVVACNSASVSVIEQLREEYPDIPFVSVIPTIIKAADRTKSGKVAVFATSTTLESDLYQKLRDDHRGTVEIIDIPCPEWAEMVETGSFNAEIVAKPVTTALKAGADQIVLGCTHYPFLVDEVQSITNGRAEVIDPGPGTAGYVKKILVDKDEFSESGSGMIHCFTTGDAAQTSIVASRLTGLDLDFQKI